MADEWKAPVNETAEERLAREAREAQREEARVEQKSWKLLEKTLLAGVQEQRRSRRWGSSSSS